MSDSETSPKSEAKDRPQAEPPSTTAPAAPRGQSLWTRLRALFALSTASLRDDLEVALESRSSRRNRRLLARPSARSCRTCCSSATSTSRTSWCRAPTSRRSSSIRPLATWSRASAHAGHSRIPIYDDNIDNITGFIHVKDALRRITEAVTDPEKEIAGQAGLDRSQQKLSKLDIVRTVLFVPPLMPVGDLLQQMQLKRVHMAIVIDEYGGTDGVVTIEDLLEAVVGEIEDEHDEEDGPLIRKINSNIFIASARAELSEVSSRHRAGFRSRRACRGRRHHRRPGLRAGRPRPGQGRDHRRHQELRVRGAAGRQPPAPPHQDQAHQAAQGPRSAGRQSRDDETARAQTRGTEERCRVA